LTPQNAFNQAAIYFEAGEYSKAAEAYELFLRGGSPGKNLDQAFFHLGICYGDPGSPTYKPQVAIQTFERLVSQFPKSPYTPAAKLMLNLHAETERLKAEIASRDERIGQQAERIKQVENALEQAEWSRASEAGQRNVQINQLRAELERLRREVERLRSDADEKEGRIRGLRNELEQLKKIDLQRRSSRPGS
jgi:outer membrane protein assembly factor BamD (BamD/ComL family)